MRLSKRKKFPENRQLQLGTPALCNNVCISQSLSPPSKSASPRSLFQLPLLLGLPTPVGIIRPLLPVSRYSISFLTVSSELFRQMNSSQNTKYKLTMKQFNSEKTTIYSTIETNLTTPIPLCNTSTMTARIMGNEMLLN